MRASSRAMLWYFWRLSRLNILLLIMLSLAAALFVRVAQGNLPSSPFAYINLIVQVLLLTGFSGCLFMFGTDRSFLPHPALLTLPMSTSRYLRLFYGYVITVTIAVSCAATAVHIQLFGDVLQKEVPKVVIYYWQLPLLCTALACLMQSLFHLSGIKNEFRVIPTAIAMEVLAWRCMMPVIDLGHDSTHGLVNVAILAILFAWACSYNSLVVHRNGRERGGITALLEMLSLGRGRTRTFSSPNRALFWFGWRRYGRIFPLWALSLSLIGVAVIGTLVLLHPDPAIKSKAVALAAAATFSIPVLVFGAAFLCHILLLMRTHEDLFGPSRGFFLTLPVRSAALVRGRALATALSVLLVMAAGTALLLVLARTNPVSRDLAPRFFLMVPLFALGLWLMLWFGLVAAAGYLALLPVMLGITILGGSADLRLIAAAVAVVSVVSTILFLIRGIRQTLLDRVDLLLFLAACLPTLIVVAQIQKYSFLDPRFYLITLVSFCLLLPVALPFIAAPVLMHWIRHR